MCTSGIRRIQLGQLASADLSQVGRFRISQDNAGAVIGERVTKRDRGRRGLRRHHEHEGGLCEDPRTAVERAPLSVEVFDFFNPRRHEDIDGSALLKLPKKRL